MTVLNKLRFLYLGSGLLTIEEVKSLKSATKKITKTRPWLVTRFRRRRSVGTLNIRADSEWTQSNVATDSVNQ